MSILRIPIVVNVEQRPCTLAICGARPWGNPYPLTREQDRIATIHKYHRWIMTQPHLIFLLPELSGEMLGCYCKPKPCHGDVLVRLFLQYELYCTQRAVSKLKRTLKYGQPLHTLVSSLNRATDRQTAICTALAHHRTLYPWIQERALVVPHK